MAKLDLNDLTLGEVAEVESLSGLPFDAIASDDKPKGKALAALAFVAKRREDKTYKFNEAMGLKFSDIAELIDFGNSDDPIAEANDPKDPEPGI